MIRPDFDKTSHLFLSYPKKFYNEYESLIPFYDELISIIPDEIHLFVITNTKIVAQEVKSKFAHKSIDTIVAKNWDEIWLRDCMGLVTRKSIIKPIYYPNYCSLKAYWNYFKEINISTKQILQNCLSQEIVDLPLILDGGNFTNNSRIAFITQKILEDNPGKKVIDMITNICELKPIIVPRNYCDTIGHTDGYMAFKDENSIFISQYPFLKLLNRDIEYVKHLKDIAESNNLEVLPMYDLPFDENADCGCKDECGCFYSAKGTYINFIRLNNYIILPEYTIPKRKQDKDYNQINEQILIDNGFNVLKINCDDVAKFGGSLHCLSWQV